MGGGEEGEWRSTELNQIKLNQILCICKDPLGTYDIML